MRKIFLSLMALFAVSTYGQVVQSDYDALNIIFTEMQGENWKNNSGWEIESSQPGINNVSNNWYGVTVDGDRVVALELDGNNLEGNLSKGIFYLTGLNKLTLSGNKLHGEIPDYFTDLRNLRHLDLSDNDFKGYFPQTIITLTGLEYLSLKGNNLEKGLPDEIGNMTALKVLLLNSNNLGDRIPESFGQLANLEHLNLALNSFSGHVPTMETENLRSVNLSSNYFMGNMPRPVNLDKNGYNLSFNHLTFVDILPNMQYLRYYKQYGPQYPFFLTTSTLTYNAGTTVQINAEELSANGIGDENTYYQWFKNGSEFTQPQNDPILTFNPIALSDAGHYTIKATHPNVPELTLESMPVYIDVKQVCGIEAIHQAKNVNATNILTRSMRITWSNGTCPQRIVFVKNQNDQTTAPPAPVNGTNYTANAIFGSGSQIGSTGWFCVYKGSATAVNVTNLLPYRDYHIMVLEFDPVSRVYNKTTVPTNPVMKQTLGIVPQDFAALKALYESTNGANWQNNTNWSTTVNNVSTRVPWYGITLGAANANPALSLEDRVVGVLLRTNNLVGTIPPSIGNLTELTSLKITNNISGGGGVNNRLSGQLPGSIGNLVKLESLNLANTEGGAGTNAISGLLPNEIGNLTQLKELYLMGNNFTGSIPLQIGNLTQLVNLNLQSNSFSGEFPSTIGNLVNLESLNVGYNNFTGSIPPQIGNLTKLQIFVAPSANFSGTIPPEIGNCISLSHLSLGSNNLSGPIPQQITNLSQLTYFGIIHNGFEGAFPSLLLDMTQLTSLWIDGNNFSGEIPDAIQNLTNLRFLSLSNNKFSGALPATVANMTNLRRLMIYNNHFSDMPNLSHINFESSVNDGLGLNVRQNNLTFASLEPNASKFNLDSRYKPQWAFPLHQTQFNYSAGSNITLDAGVLAVQNLGGENNRYALYKGTQLVQGPAASPVFVISNATPSHSGEYKILVTNTVLQALELWSVPFTITVGAKNGTVIETTEINDDYMLGLFESIKAYPNPHQGSFTVRVSNNYEGKVVITVRNSVGQIVLKETHIKGVNNQDITLSYEGSSGLYFVELAMGDRTEFIRVVKE